MNFHSLKLKASTLCAGGTLLVLSGFVTVNLAGCGGGGSGRISGSPAARAVSADFNLLQQDGTASSGGTVTLTRNGRTFTADADSSGNATINNVPTGTYDVTFTVVDNTGTSQGSTTRSIVITGNGNQNYTLVQGDTGNGRFTITGRVVANTDDGTGDFSVTNCTSNSSPISAAVLISVRDLNATNDMPIIAQLVRPAQSSSSNSPGRYSISLPYRPQSFRVEASPVSTSTTQFAGISATTTFNQTVTSIANVNVCTNTNGVFPGPEVTPTPNTTPPRFRTPIPSSTPQITAMPTATVTPTMMPTMTPTTTPTTPGTAVSGNNISSSSLVPNTNAGATVSGATTAGTISGATNSGATTSGATTAGTIAGATTSGATVNGILSGATTSGATVSGVTSGATNAGATVGGVTRRNR